MSLKIWLLIFISILQLDCFSQQKEWGLEISPKLGFLLAHRGVMGHLPSEHAIGTEISYFIHTNGSKPYHKAYKFPKVGMTLFASTVGNNKLLGQVYGTYAFIDFPFIKKPRIELAGRIGAGGSWITKVFDQEKNPKNVAMSTHFNALICLGLRSRLYLGEQRNYHLLAGIDLTHCSNGSTKVPNLGINLPYVSLGVGHTFNHVDRSQALETFEKKKWNLTAIGIISTKEVFPTGGKKYPVYAFSLVGKKIFRPRTGMELALDLMYKTSINAYKPQVPKTAEGITQLGIYCGYVLPLDKLHFVLGMGMYVRDLYFPDSRLYHRLGMRYQINEHLLVNFTLKTHWAKADYVEYGLGYTF